MLAEDFSEYAGQAVALVLAGNVRRFISDDVIVHRMTLTAHLARVHNTEETGVSNAIICLWKLA